MKIDNNKKLIVLLVILVVVFVLIAKFLIHHPLIFIILVAVCLFGAASEQLEKTLFNDGMPTDDESMKEKLNGKYAWTSIVRRNYCFSCHKHYYGPPNKYCKVCAKEKGRKYYSEKDALIQMAEYRIEEHEKQFGNSFTDNQYAIWKKAFVVIISLSYLLELDERDSKGLPIPEYVRSDTDKWNIMYFIKNDYDPDYENEPEILKQKITIDDYRIFRKVNGSIGVGCEQPKLDLKYMQPKWYWGLDQMIQYASSDSASSRTYTSSSASFTSTHYTQTSNLYSNNIGHTESDGYGGYKHYDKSGICIGHTDPDGYGGYKHYDKYEICIGHSEPDGYGGYKHYDKDEIHLGDSNSPIY